ncbi:MAG TPA: multicopper oxidase domain-containing protein [Actinomycetota bacterium]
MKRLGVRIVRRRGMLGATLVLALAAAACGSSGGAQSGKASVSVSLKEFSITPAQISVPAGVAVDVAVSNAGTAQHSFAVDVGGRTVQTNMIDPGGSATLSIPALKAGTYSAWCTVPGHKALGMSAVLVAGSSAAGTEAGQASGTSGMSGMAGMSGMSGMTPQQMADAHKASTVAFPAKTEGLGNQVLRPTMDNGVKVFALVAKQVRWEVSPGQFEDAFAYNGQVPGPQLQLHQGDRIRVVLENQLPQPTVIHFHGMTVPNAMDGVPYITQDPVFPGGSFIYEFTVKDPPGTYIYHSHFNSTEQVSMGLYGSILVLPDHPTWNEDYTEILNDGPLGYTINGKSFPATAPLTAKLGDVVHIRLANLGQMIHPFHMHGYHFSVLEQDGQPLAEPSVVDTLMIAPGQTFDVEVHAVYPGVWAFHCHILSHVEGPQGMFGMVTALIVK